MGADQAGQRVLEEMQNVGINTALVQKDDAKPTLLSVCFQYPDGSGGNITTGTGSDVIGSVLNGSAMAMDSTGT